MKLIIISILLSFTGFSQVNDSLLYQIKTIENDTERVNQLYKTGFDNVTLKQLVIVMT